jgi:acyl-CoA synthetase (NDP forming)
MSRKNLDVLFHPRSIAVVGSAIGNRYIQGLLHSHFRGAIYPIHPEGGSLYGLRVYPSIRAVPDSVDYVILCIRAGLTPRFMEEAAAKGVKVIHFFSSGFGEIEDAEGKALEKEILALGQRLGVRILGPNCMGVYCPKSGLTFSAPMRDQDAFPRHSGPLAFLSQSGGNSIFFVNDAVTRGLSFSKVISYGNGIDIAEGELLEYLAEDPDTRIIASYLEGVRDGGRFLRALKKAADAKPVLVCKVGQTEAGVRAAASHTGSMAGSQKIWEGVLKQARAVEVDRIEALTDTALLFSRCPLPAGNRVAIVGSGGGASVQAADVFSRAGFALPDLPPETKRRLHDAFGSETGCSFRNPVDIMRLDPDLLKAIHDTSVVDTLVLHIVIDLWSLIEKESVVRAAVTSFVRVKPVLTKPSLVVIHCQSSGQARRLADEAQSELAAAGFPVYPSMSRAALSLQRYVRWGRACGKFTAS